MPGSYNRGRRSLVDRRAAAAAILAVAFVFLHSQLVAGLLVLGLEVDGALDGQADRAEIEDRRHDGREVRDLGELLDVQVPAGRFEEAIALDPTNGLAYQNLASMVLRQALASKSARERQSRLQEAERYARQALDTDPSLPKAYTTLGVVLAESGRKAEAIDSWKRAVALDGREFDALYNLTVLLLEAQRLDDARGYAQQFAATAPPALYRPAIEQIRKFLGS